MGLGRCIASVLTRGSRAYYGWVTIQERLQEIIEDLSEEHLRALLEFAEFLDASEEREAWNRFGLDQLAKLYEGDEADYSLADIIPDRR